jgi:hypothetical protein
VSINFYNNDISHVEDNCIETDGAAHNIRILRNRCFNHGHRALSVQRTRLLHPQRRLSRAPMTSGQAGSAWMAASICRHRPVSTRDDGFRRIPLLI